MLRRPILDETLVLHVRPPVMLDASITPRLLRARIGFAQPWWMRQALGPQPLAAER